MNQLLARAVLRQSSDDDLVQIMMIRNKVLRGFFCAAFRLVANLTICADNVNSGIV